MLPLRTLIVDDEPLARRRLEIILADNDSVRIVGCASGCAEAREAIRRHRPQVVLMDVMMRDGTGFDVLESVPDDNFPSVIFVTAFDSFAARAFDAAAIDYVLKPIETPRLNLALARARERWSSRELEARLQETRAVLATLKNAASPGGGYEREFWVRRNASGMVRVAVEDINYVTAEVDYVRLHLAEQSYLARETLTNLQSRLDPGVFLRVHRSSIVRISAIREIKRSRVGVVEVHVVGGARLRVGRAYNRALRDALRVN
jgi:DNA-binding LytR/AlgR family response regulator